LDFYITLSEGEYTYGVIDRTWWALRKNGERVGIYEHPHAFFPFLEVNCILMEHRIRTESAKTPAPYAWNVFPLHSLIKAGLHSKMEYWEALSLDRMDELCEKGSFVEDLRALSLAGTSQRIRQRAKKSLGAVLKTDGRE